MSPRDFGAPAQACARRARSFAATLVLPTRRPAQPPEALDPVVSGHVLLTAAGVGLLGSAPLLHPDQRGWLAVLGVSAVLVAALLTSARLNWSTLPRRATFAFPVLVCGALCAVSLAQPGLAAPLGATLTLCFAYVGLSQPPWTSLWLLPFGGAALILAHRGFSSGFGAELVVRLLTAATVWTSVAELLAWVRTRQNALSHALTDAATVDQLTGVPNRADLDLQMARLAAGDTLVICDLDHFTFINNTLGRSFGDRVLAEFGSVLRATLRGHDYCARYGGQEFVLLLARTSHGQAQTLLVRLREHWATLQPAVTFSAGVATHTAGRSSDATFAAADTALYTAKNDGRNTTRVEQHQAHSPA